MALNLLSIPADTALYGEKLSIVLGFITAIAALATFTTCRNFIALVMKFGFMNPLQVRWYNKFYQSHGYYWPILWITLVLHIITALMHSKWPQAGAPDSVEHLNIFIAGLVSFVAMIVLGLSCRAFGVFVNTFTGQIPLEIRLFAEFYRHHGLYWFIFLTTFTVHFVFAYLHVGFWPSGV